MPLIHLNSLSLNGMSFKRLFACISTCSGANKQRTKWNLFHFGIYKYDAMLQSIDDRKYKKHSIKPQVNTESIRWYKTCLLCVVGVCFKTLMVKTLCGVHREVKSITLHWLIYQIPVSYQIASYLLQHQCVYQVER